MLYVDVVKIGALTKVAENLKNYSEPDKVSKSSYSRKTNFNQEDWLNRANSSSSDSLLFTDSTSPVFTNWGTQTYSHLPGVYRAAQVELMSFHSDGMYNCLGLVCKGKLIGYFNELNVLNDVFSKKAYDILDKNGAGQIREKEGSSPEAWSAYRDNTLACLNVRYRPEDLVILPDPIELAISNDVSNYGYTKVSSKIEVSQRATNKALRSKHNNLFLHK